MIERGNDRNWAAVVAVCAVVAALGVGPASAQVRANYLYSLSNFSGPLPYDFARVAVDQARDETYVVSGNRVHIYSASGMEVFGFGDDLNLGQLLDVAVDDDGHIILLSHKDMRTVVTRCSYRGIPIGTIEITNLPAGLSFGANRMFYRNGLFYFSYVASGIVIITDADGRFRDRIDLFPQTDVSERKKLGAEAIGFAVDKEGSVFFTVPVLFEVYKFSPDRKLTSFGRPGSTPGRFGVLAGIATDSRGNLLVLDKLRCVVMVFDKDFNFITEFGERGGRADNLIVPDDIAVDRNDRVYVTQGRKRGVSVFALSYN